MGPFSYLFSLFKGWNLEGKTSLFPQSYMSLTPPPALATSSTLTDSHGPSNPQHLNILQPLHEETNSVITTTTNNGIYHSSNGYGWESSQSNGKVIKATMMDIQKAIKQLSRNDSSSIHNDMCSFSFASSRTGDGDLTDHKTDMDIEAETDQGMGGED